MKELLRFQGGSRFLCFDYETTCLSLLPDWIQIPYSLGWTVNDGKNKIIEREDWLLWPDLVDTMKQWGKGAIEVTHWTEKEYNSRATPPEQSIKDFESYLYNPNIISIGANSWSFDCYVHNICRRKLGLKPDWSWMKNHFDIQCIAKSAHLGITPPPIGTDEWIFFNIKMSNYHRRGLKTNLAHMCKEYGIQYDAAKHHTSAVYDVGLAYEIFRKQIQIIDISF